MAPPRNIEIKGNMLSSNVYRLPYVVLGNRGYLIDESSFKFKRQRHNNIILGSRGYLINESLRHNNRDMISDLPDNILHRILSFLSIKDAVKTSILAKNWRYLWTYLPILHFRMLSTPQNRYHNTLSKSTSLTQLSLQLAKTILCIPTGIPFPSLKTLNLSYATFANNNSLEQFLSRCPLLQDLTLFYCYLFYINKITIAISTLRKLTIRIDRFCLGTHDLDNYLVQIEAVNLLSLCCTSVPTIQFRIINPPTSILDAYIDFGCSELINHNQHVSPCSLLLLGGLANVKSLTVTSAFFQFPLYKSDHLHLLPEFHNLTHLCLGLNIFTIPSRKLILEFLLRCPKLEVLVIPLGLPNFSRENEYALKLVPPCFKSSLKILHITNFDEYEIKFAKFLLENARLLEEIQITYSSYYLSSVSNKIADLENQLKGMGSCAIKFQ